MESLSLLDWQWNLISIGFILFSGAFILFCLPETIKIKDFFISLTAAWLLGIPIILIWAENEEDSLTILNFIIVSIGLGPSYLVIFGMMIFYIGALTFLIGVFITDIFSCFTMKLTPDAFQKSKDLHSQMISLINSKIQ